MPPAWAYPLNLDNLGLGWNPGDSSWLLGSTFGLDALTSSIPTVSPELNSAGGYNGNSSHDSPFHHQNMQGWEPSPVSERPSQATHVSPVSTSVAIHAQWHTLPKANTAPQDPLPIRDDQQQVDDTYRARLSTRLAPNVPDDALPSADLLVSIIFS